MVKELPLRSDTVKLVEDEDFIGDRKIQALNRKGDRRSSSKYKGVYLDEKCSKWISRLKVDGKQKYLGSFDCEDDAAEAYNAAVLENYGEDAYRNIIGEDNSANNVTVQEMLRAERRKNKPTYRGVYIRGEKRYISAQIVIGDRTVYLGTFNTRKKAARAYDKKAYELYGDKAILNFPEEYKTSI